MAGLQGHRKQQRSHELTGYPRMTDPLPRLTWALADRYRIEREIGSGGMEEGGVR